MSQLTRAVHRTLGVIRITNKQDSWELKELSGLSRLTEATLHSLLHVLETEEYVRTLLLRSRIDRLTSAIRELGSRTRPCTTRLLIKNFISDLLRPSNPSPKRSPMRLVQSHSGTMLEILLLSCRNLSTMDYIVQFSKSCTAKFGVVT
ncbi:hypothetical protein SAMN05414139_05311 [Burkholderia sp. D7]|nr:hypothetical protein SAMN05414139_05311 [Burkholderia sp. D7]